MAHIHDAIDFTVEVFIVYNNTVLLRKHDKYKLWLSVGGHIELNEDPNEAAIREVYEEVGLSVELCSDLPFTRDPNYTELVPPVFLNRHRINETHEHLTLVYFARATTDTLILSRTEKSDECKWFTKEELDDSKYSIKDSIKLYARTALEKLRT